MAAGQGRRAQGCARGGPEVHLQSQSARCRFDSEGPQGPAQIVELRLGGVFEENLYVRLGDLGVLDGGDLSAWGGSSGLRWGFVLPICPATGAGS